MKSDVCTKPILESLILIIFGGIISATVPLRRPWVKTNQHGIECYTDRWRKFAKWAEIESVEEARPVFFYPCLILRTDDSKNRMYIPLAVGGDLSKLFAAIRELAPPDNVLRKYVQEHYGEDGKEKQPAADS